MFEAPNPRRNDMRTRTHKVAALVGIMAALGVGGTAVAGAATNATSTPPPATAPADTGAPVTQGDQTAPDVAGAPETSAESTTSESAPSDGPGGYADTNPAADTQQQGEN
jgi:hypothetical protein